MSKRKIISPHKAERLRATAERERRTRRRDKLFLWLVVLLMVASTTGYFYLVAKGYFSRPHRHHQHQTKPKPTNVLSEMKS